MKGALSVSREDQWLLRLVVLLHAAKGPVSTESLLVEFQRRRISGVTAPMLGRILTSLFRRKFIRKVSKSSEQFRVTKLGREAATETATHLRALVDLDSTRNRLVDLDSARAITVARVK